MGSRFQRLRTRAEPAAGSGGKRTPDQIRAREKATPCLGERLAAATCSVGTRTWAGTIYRHTVVAPSGSSAFGLLHTSKGSEAPSGGCPSDGLPFSAERTLPCAPS